MNEQQLAATNTRFAFKLFGEIVKQEGGKNVFISPVSVALALAMTLNGARGGTAKAMADALELGRADLEEINRASAALIQSLQNADPEVRLAIANSLWARQGVAFRPDFLQRNREFYGAEARALDFADRSAAATINEWVRAHTAGKIEKIIDAIDPAAMLFLINAIYFKGNWTRKFDARLTREGPFMLADGRQIQARMMTQSGEYAYYEGEGFQAASLPYGGGRLVMDIFLPATRDGLDAFCRGLSAKTWDTWLRRFRPTDGMISLPRFKVEYGAKLNDALGALGMAAAFGPRADFSGMAENDAVLIDEVLHKTFVEVNEEGTEAAAVTSVGIRLTSFAPQRRFTMVVDRPFFCAIRDRQTGAILFMGAITEP